MKLATAKKVIDKLESFCNLVNDTVGLLKAEYNLTEDDWVTITITKNVVENDSIEVANFLFSTFFEELRNINKAYQDDFKNHITCVYSVEYDAEERTNDVIKVLTEVLYNTVDIAKVEYTSIVEKDVNHNIPAQVCWELEEWNSKCDYNEDEDGIHTYDDLMVYRLDKKRLYGLSLGIYKIDLGLIESDLVPELISVLFESTEDFCYVTAFEDKDYIYFYTTTELNDDNIYDIEEGLIQYLDIISVTNPDETLEDFYYKIVEKEEYKKIMLNKEDLIKTFDEAKENNLDVAIELTVPTREDTEIIIVRNGNLDYKLNYYLNNYNDKLELERCTDIKMIDFYPFNWDE